MRDSIYRRILSVVNQVDTPIIDEEFQDRVRLKKMIESKIMRKNVTKGNKRKKHEWKNSANH